MQSRLQLFLLTYVPSQLTLPVWTLFLFESIWTRPQGCQKIRIFLQIKLLSFCYNIASKMHKLQKIIKMEKKMSKNLVFLSISNILQFGGNISAPNLKWRIQWTLMLLLTHQGSLGANSYRMYQGFSICF